ncbi:MAG: GH39 family glycosyl hydrolase, partial [Nocardioidaceae bacterium]
LLHGGFGLRTVGELRKPRWWALALLERLGERRLPVALSGDGADSLVEVLATRSGDGDGRDTVSVLAWNGTLDQTKAAGSDALARDVEVRVAGLEPGAAYTLSHHRVDAAHSNIASTWGRIRRDGQDWPDEEQWQTLRAADRLETLEPDTGVTADEGGTVTITFALPMPAVSLLDLTQA